MFKTIQLWILRLLPLLRKRWWQRRWVWKQKPVVRFYASAKPGILDVVISRHRFKIKGYTVSTVPKGI